jgi:hypothetical protein
MRLPEKTILGVTLETNRDLNGISKAINPERRANDFQQLVQMNKHRDTPCTIMVCMEPLLDFDTDKFNAMVKTLEPQFTYIGLNSGRADVTEPSNEKLSDLYKSLLSFSDVMVKDKLAKMIGVQPGLNKA